MPSIIEKDFESIRLKDSLFGSKESYVMKGTYSEKELDLYHLIIAPSFQCNLSCKHCYISDHNSMILPKEKVLSIIDEWSDIVAIERGKFGGIFHLKGGEPLVLPYLKNVLEKLEKIKTLRFMMTTNGVTEENDIIEHIESLNTSLNGNVQIIVSIDGSNDYINAKIRNAGNFEKAVAFVKKLRQAGIAVFLNNVIHNGNINDIQSYVEFAIQLDVQQINFLTFVPKGYGEKVKHLTPDPNDVHKRIHAVWDKGNQRVKNLLAGSLSDILNSETCGTCASPECVGGYRGLFYIEPDGKTYSCPNLNIPELEAGNILHNSLYHIHETLKENVYQKIKTFDFEIKDKYFCKGLRYLKNSMKIDLDEFKGFKQENLQADSSNSISFCFSRNF